MLKPNPWLLVGALLISGSSTAFAQEKKTDDTVELEKFTTEAKATDATSVINDKPTGAVFGIDKSLTDTPRQITVVTGARLDSMGIRNAEDLVKVSPGAFSNFRFGVQGNVSIRNQTSDFYFRGMKRLDPQGNFKSVFTANDSLEIVSGPPSPVFGLGRIGGYINFNPKTGRAEDGKYLTSDTGNVKVTYGSYDKKIVSGELSGPSSFFGKQAGYSVYAYIEDAGAWKVNGFSQQQIVQATYTINLTKAFRAEMGTVLQHSYGGAPGGDARAQAPSALMGGTIKDQSYWSDSANGNVSGFSYQIDENGDGKISMREIRDAYFGINGIAQSNTNTASPLDGTSAIGPATKFTQTTNETFFRSIPWQGGIPNQMGALNPNLASYDVKYTDRNGNLTGGGAITLDTFNKGYTQAVVLPAGTVLTDAQKTQIATQGWSYTTAANGVITVNQMRKGYQLKVYGTTVTDGTLTANNKLPNRTVPAVPFYLSPVFDLNPNAWVQKKWNKRMSLGEDYYRANVHAFYFDLINDYNPDYTFKNQIFADGHQQIKDGSNGFSQWQNPNTLEDKVTYTRKFKPTSWWDLNLLSSANIYMVETSRLSTNGDIDWRRDLQHANQDNLATTFTAQDRFYSVIENRTYDGYPLISSLKNRYAVSGLGVVTDQTFFGKINLIAGARWDYVDAKSYTPAGLYTGAGYAAITAPYLVGPGTATASATGDFTNQAYTSRGNSSGPSLSSSLTYLAPYGFRPYVTVGQQSVILTQASAQELTMAQTVNNLLGQATLLEAGLKWSLKDKITASFAAYDQTRSSFTAESPVTAGGANTTLSRGYEANINFQLDKHFSVVVGGSWTKSKYKTGGGTAYDGREAGYPDVIDPVSGKVIIPAEAFEWGGRTLAVTIPDSDPRYREVQGIPNHIVTVTPNYTFDSGYFIQSTIFNQGSFAADRLQTIQIPQATSVDFTLGFRNKKWEVYAVLINAFDKALYNQASLGIDPKQNRTLDFTIVRHF